MKRPLKNLLSLGLGDAASRVVGFLVTVYLARTMGPSDFGVFNIGFAVLGYLGLVASPGIQVLEARNAARLTGIDAERVGAVVSLRLVLALLLWGGTIGVSHLAIEDEMTRHVIILFAAALVPLALMLDWFFQGKEDFVVVGLAKLVNYAVYGSFVLVLVQSSRGPLMAAAAFGAGNVAGAVLLWTIYHHRCGPVGLQWSPVTWRHIAAAGVPVGAAMLLTQSAINLPPLVIGMIAGNTDVGWYSAAMKLVFFLLIIDRLLNALFLPAVTRYVTSRPDEAPYFVAITSKVIILAALPAVMLGVVLAPVAITWVFGSGYDDAIPVLQILMGFFLFTLLNSIYMATLIGAGREAVYTHNAAVGALLLVLMVVALTLLAGIEGAAFGVVAGEFLILALMMRATKLVLPLRLGTVVTRPMIAGIVMVLTAYFSREAGPPAAGALACAAYVVSIIALKGFTRQEFRFLRERFV
jgi:O-antigen/teichoic acid export membrane protein